LTNCAAQRHIAHFYDSTEIRRYSQSRRLFGNFFLSLPLRLGVAPPILVYSMWQPSMAIII